MDVLDLTNESIPPALDLAFRSGMSRSKDLHAGIGANVPVGVVAGELLFLQRMITIPRYLQAGGAVFIDSGAFSELKTGIEPDFERVLGVYREIAEHVRDMGMTPSNLYVVAPDKVGDQWASIERLCKYEKQVRELIDMGVQVIIPIQSGPIEPAELVTSIALIVETRSFIVGVPSNAAAMSIEECARLDHHSYHILGRVQRNAQQDARVAALRLNNPSALITADANWLRSRLALVAEKAAEIRASGERHPFLAMRELSVRAAIECDKTWAVS
jgi:hypothetical protein